MPEHRLATQIHKGRYIDTSDPGAVGAGVEWLDTNTSPAIHKKRNAGNTGWDTVLDPSSYATTTALALKAPLASPTFTGTVVVPNQSAGDNSTKAANTAYADAAAAAAVPANDSITDAKLRNSAALSVIGRSANSTGDPADIAAASDGDVMRRSGTTLGFGAIPESSVTNLTTDLAAKAPLASPAFTGTPTVPADAYDATTWNGNNGIPTKDAIRDKIESLATGGVSSFNSRTGAVSPAANDYAIADVSGLASVAANLILAGPSSGGSAAAAMRALVAADIPSLAASKITTGQLATARGGTGIDASAAANGELFIGNGSGLTKATLTAGANVTITNGAGTITIAASAAGAAGYVMREEQIASASAALTFTAWPSSAYEVFVAEVFDMITASNTDLSFQVSTDGGSTWLTTAGDYEMWGNYAYSAGTSFVGGASLTRISLRPGASTTLLANCGYAATLKVYNPAGAKHKMFTLQSVVPSNADGMIHHVFSGRIKTTAAITAIRVIAVSGNLTSGTARVYGIAKA